MGKSFSRLQKAAISAGRKSVVSRRTLTLEKPLLQHRETVNTCFQELTKGCDLEGWPRVYLVSSKISDSLIWTKNRNLFSWEGERVSLNYYVHSSFIHNDQMSSKLWYILTEKYYLATKRIKLLVRQHGIILKKKKKKIIRKRNQM